jgi:hypothetical protein
MKKKIQLKIPIIIQKVKKKKIILVQKDLKAKILEKIILVQIEVKVLQKRK